MEIFGSIQFTKLSILTGIIKIGLKAFLESVRLRTFGKFGLQQVQVKAMQTIITSVILFGFYSILNTHINILFLTIRPNDVFSGCLIS